MTRMLRSSMIVVLLLAVACVVSVVRTTQAGACSCAAGPRSALNRIGSAPLAIVVTPLKTLPEGGFEVSVDHVAKGDSLRNGGRIAVSSGGGRGCGGDEVRIGQSFAMLADPPKDGGAFRGWSCTEVSIYEIESFRDLRPVARSSQPTASIVAATFGAVRLVGLDRAGAIVASAVADASFNALALCPGGRSFTALADRNGDLRLEHRDVQTLASLWSIELPSTAARRQVACVDGAGTVVIAASAKEGSPPQYWRNRPDLDRPTWRAPITEQTTWDRLMSRDTASSGRSASYPAGTGPSGGVRR